MRLYRHSISEKLAPVFRASFRHAGVAIGAAEFRTFSDGGCPLHFLLARVGFDFRRRCVARCPGLGEAFALCLATELIAFFFCERPIGVDIVAFGLRKRVIGA